MRKGHKDFVVVLVDLDRHELVGMVSCRTHEAMGKELEGWPDGVLESMEEVSIDLSGNYRGLVKKWMPNAEIVADRFHVMKQVNQELNKARNQVLRGELSPGKEIEPERVKEALKQSKYALLKLEDNLTEKQKLKLEEVQSVSPRLFQMHQLKESFRDLFETSLDEVTGTVKLLDWMEKAKDYFPDSVATFGRWFGEVTSYFCNRTSNGAVEGINNKLKLIKRMGYGFANFERFRLRCLICWHLNLDSA